MLKKLTNKNAEHKKTFQTKDTQMKTLTQTGHNKVIKRIK